MYFSTATVLFAAAALAAPAAAGTALFSCHQTEEWGYGPKCCTNLNGQIGINCVGAHQQGVTDPTWQCNEHVNNVNACCQSMGLKNPYTNDTVDLCAMSVDQ